MKSIKRIVFAAIFAIGAIILVACSGAAKSDNGTYVYEASKDFIKNTLKEQGASSEEAEKYADQFSLKMTIEIKDTKGKVTLEAKAMGNKKNQDYKLKVDQKNKTLESEKGGNDKVKYKIDGDVLTLDLSQLESGQADKATLAIFKDAKFKRTK